MDSQNLKKASIFIYDIQRNSDNLCKHHNNVVVVVFKENILEISMKYEYGIC